MASCLFLQVAQRYCGQADALLASAPPDLAGDFALQLSKVAVALTTGSCSPSQEEVARADRDGFGLEKYTVAPRMLKHVVAKGNREFSSSRQQDASEYFQHVLDLMNKFEKQILGSRLALGPCGKFGTANVFQFRNEVRFQCRQTGQVKYDCGSHTQQTIMELRIPLDAAINSDEIRVFHERKRKHEESSDAAPGPVADEPPMLRILFESCLDTYFGGGEVQMTNPSVGATVASTKTRLSNFPRYLMIKLGRYYVDESWRQKKIDAAVHAPETLDLSAYRATGLQPDEVPMESSAGGGDARSGSGSANAPQYDLALVQQVCGGVMCCVV